MQLTYHTVNLSEAMLVAALNEKYIMMLSDIHVERKRKGSGRDRQACSQVHAHVRTDTRGAGRSQQTHETESRLNFKS